MRLFKLLISLFSPKKVSSRPPPVDTGISMIDAVHQQCVLCLLPAQEKDALVAALKMYYSPSRGTKLDIHIYQTIYLIETNHALKNRSALHL